MARRQVYSAAAFKKKMDAFIGYCESEGIDATDYQLIRFFGITPDALESYRPGIKQDGAAEETAGFAAALKKLDLYREDATLRQIVSDPKLASHGALKLKQPHWAVGAIKPNRQDVTVRVKIGDGDSALLD